MSSVNMFFATGFEEVEALTAVDLLRRSGVDVNMVSITDKKEVTGSHGIIVNMDKAFLEAPEADMLILPGGAKGTENLFACEPLKDMIKDYYSKNKYLAAICAAPTIFGRMGLLKERRATCYPGMENELFCKEALEDGVVMDDRIITSRGLGTAIDFSLALVSVLAGDEQADSLAEKIVYYSWNN